MGHTVTVGQRWHVDGLRAMLRVGDRSLSGIPPARVRDAGLFGTGGGSRHRHQQQPEPRSAVGESIAYTLWPTNGLSRHLLALLSLHAIESFPTSFGRSSSLPPFMTLSSSPRSSTLPSRSLMFPPLFLWLCRVTMECEGGTLLENLGSY